MTAAFVDIRHPYNSTGTIFQGYLIICITGLASLQRIGMDPTNHSEDDEDFQFGM